MALGRIKATRQRKPAEEAEPDPEFESYLAALEPEDDVESTGSGRRFGNAEVHQLRLPLLANERLKELAFKQGTSPAALARDWVMQHLEVAEKEPAPAPEPAPQPPQHPPQWPGEETAQHDITPDPDPYAGAGDPFQPNPDNAHPGLQAGPAPAAPAPPAPPGPAGQAQYPDVERTEEITVPHGRFQ
ncbi:hypothetical protein [Saccharopolyspora griseoalba]|uniref:CopG family transcriptional regulator n=1 Tax=Saccharopolyspora griseoalba TaxID=1431848 RepID=A0ABW2LG86_9PSEU